MATSPRSGFLEEHSPFPAHTGDREHVDTDYDWTHMGGTLESAPHPQGCVLHPCTAVWPVFLACASSSSLVLGTFPTKSLFV